MWWFSRVTGRAAQGRFGGRERGRRSRRDFHYPAVESMFFKTCFHTGSPSGLPRYQLGGIYVRNS